MKFRKSVFVLVSAFSLAFASCNKDLVVKQDETLSAQVSDNASVNDVVETSPLVHTMVQYNVNSNVAGFWQSVPSLYNQTTKKYPLIIFIHGIGELGTSLKRINCCGLPKHINNKTFPANFKVNGSNYSFIVVSPQFKVQPNAASVQSVIDFAKNRFRIDESRIYVTGLSMGGGSTWNWSATFGQNAAAIVPVCGSQKPSASMAASIASKNLPIWGIYSTQDAVVPVQWGKDFFSMIDGNNSALSAQTKLTVWTDASHNLTWGRAFNPATVIDGYNIYSWMLLHKRGSASAAPAPAPVPVPAPVPTPVPVPVPAPDTATTATNNLPVAVAGDDKTIYLSQGINRVTLDATASKDFDGNISNYEWSKISGPAATMFTFGTGKTYAAHLVKGTYTFQVKVTDNNGASSTDTRVIYVK